MRRRLSIKNRLAGYFGTIMVLGLLVNGILASYLCKDIINQRAMENLERVLIDCTDKINIILNAKKTDIETFSRIPFLMSEDNSIEEKLEFLKEINATAGFRDLAFVDTAGNSYGADGKRVNVKDSAEYKKALFGEVAFSAGIELEDETVFTIASPVRNKGNEIIGVLMGVESIDSFNKILENSGISDEFVVLDNNAWIVAHSDKEILENQVPMEEMPGKSEFNEVYDLYQKMLSGKRGVDLVKRPETGIHNFLSYGPLANGWSVALINFYDDVMKPVYLFYQVIGLSTLGVIIVGVIAVYLISKNISIRINEIAFYLDTVARGDFEQPIPAELLGMKDEMGDVARALDGVKSEIDEMLATIKDCTDYMNEQMEDFTGDIKEALKNVVISQELSKEEMEDVTDRINALNQISDYINDSVSKNEMINR